MPVRSRSSDRETTIDAASAARLVTLLNRFSVEMTSVVDRVIGTDYAGNAEILTLVALCRSEAQTFEELMSVSGLSRRSISRFAAFLGERGLVVKRRSPEDRRAAMVELTPVGRRHREEMELSLDEFFEEARPLSKEIADLLSQHVDGSAPKAESINGIGMLERVAAAGAELNKAVVRRTGKQAILGRHQLAMLLVSAGTRRPGELAEELALTSGGMTYVVDQLERRGMIERRYRRDIEDRRAVEIFLTPRGQGLADRTLAGILDMAPMLHDLFVTIRDRVTA